MTSKSVCETVPYMNICLLNAMYYNNCSQDHDIQICVWNSPLYEYLHFKCYVLQ